MKEEFQFRLLADDAAKLLPRGVGTKKGISLKVDAEPTDPLFATIGRTDRDLRAERGHGFITAWKVQRTYDRQEVENALFFTVKVKRLFEPAGEECGTRYDESHACPLCGSGAPQVSKLVVDVGRIPRGVDIATTIAGETIVSSNFVNRVRRAEMSGIEFDDVLQHRSGSALGEWFQLRVPTALAVSRLTQAGATPFLDHDSNWCPRGDWVGEGLVSELFVHHPEGHSDVFETKQYFGVRRGLLRPRPVLIFSARLRRLVADLKLLGIDFEIAHAV